MMDEVMEFSQDEIDLMLAAVNMWLARLEWERGPTQPVPNLAHRHAGIYTNNKLMALENKLKSW